MIVVNRITSIGRKLEEFLEPSDKIHRFDDLKSSELLKRSSLRSLGLYIAYRLQSKEFEAVYERRLAMELLKESIRQKKLGE